MDQFTLLAQRTQDTLQNILLRMQSDQYHFVLRFGDLLLYVVLPLFLVLLFFFCIKHPLYFIARKNSILKLSWRKIGHYYHFEKTAKILAENDHYGFKPSMDIVLYRSNQQLFSSVEVFSLGSKRFALCIPEKMWNLGQDNIFAQLLKPKMELKSKVLAVNTIVFFITNILKRIQHKTFNFINSKISNSDIKNFMLISIYIFFLPLVYTRLNLRFYTYYTARTHLPRCNVYRGKRIYSYY